MEPAFNFFHLRVVGEEDDHIPGVLSLDRHGGAATSVDHSLDLVALRGGDAAGQHYGCNCHCSRVGDSCNPASVHSLPLVKYGYVQRERSIRAAGVELTNQHATPYRLHGVGPARMMVRSIWFIWNDSIHGIT